MCPVERRSLPLKNANTTNTGRVRIQTFCLSLLCFLLRSHYVAQPGPVLKRSSCLRHPAARALEDWEPEGHHQFVREDPEHQLELAFLPSCSPKLCSFSLSGCISLTTERDFGCTLYYPQECQLFIL